MLFVHSPRAGTLGSPRHPGALSPRADWSRRSRSSSRRQVCPWAFKEGDSEPKQQQKEPKPQHEAAAGGPAVTPPGAGPCASVTFKACHRVSFGQKLKVVGDLPQLGAWDCDQAPAMTWSEGDQWLLTLDLPPGRHNFKVVVAHATAGCFDWEVGPNRTLQVPAPEAAAHGAFTVVCEWGRTASSLETLPEEELGLDEDLPGTESDEPALRPEDLSAEPYSANGDEGESPVSVVGKMTVEGSPASKQTPPMGEGADAALRGEPAGGLKPSTEAAVKKELQQSALTGSTPAGQGSSSDDEDDYGPPSGSSGGSLSGSRAGPAQQEQEQHGQGPPESASAASVTTEPPPGLLLAATAAGLAALPVVVWSEWVLKTTGCGLPPGPSGLLGAAEGVSYLVVGSIALWSLARKLSTGNGLPAGPAGALGAVEGGSWLAVVAGAAVLAVQWQTYGYIPSALPDSNCFGGEASPSTYSLGQRPAPADPAGASQQLAAAPEPGPGPLSISRQVHTAAALPLPPLLLPRGRRPAAPLPRRA